VLRWLHLVISVALVAYPRFDRQDASIIKELVGQHNGHALPGDSPYYTNYVEYFRGKAPIDSVILPFRYRPLVPFIASLLPVKSPMTSINIINLLALYITVLYLFLLLRALGFCFNYALCGSFMFTISFPVFYYGTVGCIDPVIICLLTIGTYLIYRSSWPLLVALVTAGGLAKEIIVLLIPVALAYLWVNKREWKLKTLILCIGFVIPIVVVRKIFIETGEFYWIPSLDTFASNIRLRAILSILLTLGIPGLLALGAVVHYRDFKPRLNGTVVVPLLIGILFTLFLVIYSMLTAYTDGRFIWPMVIYTIPFALWEIRYWKERKGTYLSARSGGSKSQRSYNK